MMMQIQIFNPVVFAHKCEVNMISTLPLLCFWYLRKSTNLTYIYTDLLYLQSIKFAYSTKCRQIWCKSICLHHCFTNVVEASNKNICTCFTHVLLQEQICSYTLNLYDNQTNKFALVISHLPSMQIWPSLMNLQPLFSYLYVHFWNYLKSDFRWPAGWVLWSWINKNKDALHVILKQNCLFDAKNPNKTHAATWG